ncbi:MAG: SLBB domain-containing protein [Acidobacteria bacterium]|nr:SLBB domain-containing protein [Acidobacteriota bacterium]
MKTMAWVFLLMVSILGCAGGKGIAPDGTTAETPEKKTYLVKGEVNQPGEQEWTEGARLSTAIAKAGGPTAKAGVNHINLIRMKQVTIHDLDKIKRGEDTDTPLMAGDVVLVPRVLEPQQ